MAKDNMTTLDNWGIFLLNRILHPFTIFGAPAFLLGLTGYFMITAFGHGLYIGIRSAAATILPLIVVTYIFIFQAELLKKIGTFNILVAYFSSLFWGTMLMLLIRVLSDFGSTIPISEFVLSSSFSILLFSYISLPQNKVLSYYYGMVSGFLLYITFFGFPIGPK